MSNASPTLDDLNPYGWEGHARSQALRMARLPLYQKIAWLEEIQRVAKHLQVSRRRSKTPPSPSPLLNRPAS